MIKILNLCAVKLRKTEKTELKGAKKVRSAEGHGRAGDMTLH